MAIIYRIDYETYQEYQTGHKRVPSSTRFVVLDTNTTHFDSYSPDPQVVVHSHLCPHKPAGHSYYYRMDQLPEGYVNMVTPECVDQHSFMHTPMCPHSVETKRHAMFCDWLRSTGNAPIETQRWVEPSDPDKVEHVAYACPLCPKDSQPAFTYCEHGLPFHKLTNAAWQFAHIPQYPTPECRIDSQHETLGCHWSLWYHCHAYGPGVQMIRYSGCVLSEYEHNGYDDSDFYAIVWDEASKSIRTIEYNTTRFAGGGSCQIDASEDVLDMAEAAARLLFAHKLYDESVVDSRQIAIGKRVRVIKAVKRAKRSANNVPIGMEGEVTHIRDGDYGMQVCFVDDEDDPNAGQGFQRYHWVSPDKLEVVDSAQYVCDPSEAYEKATNIAHNIRLQRRWALVNYMPTPGYICAL